MGTRLTVIVDNVAVGHWTGEWGLSDGSAWTAYETVKKACHCEQAQRADVAIRDPVLWPPCERGLSAKLTEGFRF